MNMEIQKAHVDWCRIMRFTIVFDMK